MRYTKSGQTLNQVSAFGILSCSALCSALPTYAQPQISPYAIIQPTDAVEGNDFGLSPVVHDGKLYVGAGGVQNAGNAGTGGVYVFDVQTLAQEKYIHATTSPPNLPPERFGQSIAVQDGKLLVGSREDDPVSTVKAGAAYLFEYPSGNQIARYTQTNGGDNWPSPSFGEGVALIGDVAVVSDPNGAWTPTGGGNKGTVNFYDISSGQQVESLNARYAPSGHFSFGEVLAVWNNQLIVAYDTGNSIHFYDPETHELLYEIAQPGYPVPSHLVFFGTDLAVFGDTLVVSEAAYFYEEYFPSAVHIFDLNTRELIRTITITPDRGDRAFGRRIAANDKYLITKLYKPGFSGGAMALVYDTATGEQLGELLPLTDDLHNGFVYDGIAIDGDTAFIGNSAIAELPNPGGAILVYDLSQLGATCIADTNGDGVLSPADFSAWVAAFNAMAPECDQNGDGACSPADFSAWVANFNAGC